jgi:RND family efflux transporter MFP subunit
VDADESVDIRPTVPGKVVRVLVDEGDQVSAGQVLAEVDHDVLTKQLAALQPQYDLSVDVYNRQKRLWDQKIGSEIQLLQVQTQKESLEKQIESIKENIDMYLIKSPISGTVDFVGLKVGELASAGVLPAFSVINLSGLKVSAEIAESYSAKVKTGNPVLLHFPDLKKDTQARITFVERSISALTRTFKIEADLLGENSEYHPNMVSVVRIVDYENPSAIVVPINAVQTINGEDFIYKAVVEGNGSVARKIKVTTGMSYDGKIEVTSGLAANDKIVTSGQNELADGMNIRF